MWKRQLLLPGEFGRVGLLAFLLFTNTLVLESSEVIATSGFVSQVGVDQILVVWATVMLVAMVTSSLYALVVDRIDRVWLGVALFCGASLVYLGLYALFVAGAPSFFAYGLLAIFTEQQWTLLPLLIWTLANDLFSVAAAKRLFPLLSASVLIGGVVGNALVAALGQWLGAATHLLLVLNGVLLLLGAVALAVIRLRVTLNLPSAEAGDHLRDMVKEGFEFVREVPAYRFLALIMILMGFALNTIQYQFLVDLAAHFTGPGQLQTFYGLFKIASVPVLLVIQAFLTPWLLKQPGFKGIFAVMPGSMFLALLLMLFWLAPVGGLMLTGAIIGNYLIRLVLTGIDQPARQAFQGMIPDQRRGRVSTFMEGYLYPAGSILSCLVTGGVVLLMQQGWLAPLVGRSLYLAVATISALVALMLARQLYLSYDQSMLNWRLKRRQHRRSVLDQLEF
ncbi:Npt1/Npt2 family nucleotide transporter [Candidatus Chloroploca sp. Khr17]|uniref:Npt1/Npt2 family nucleotide transporter n=1 Tax=Candidatus Chloroploca sp. Khr17 TaxID=2496869 RepID=UPI00101C309E|nr:Npt1/Npt2 family nucleotide transporter [Candidatus Chloroploca sp. Khr17]